MPRNLFRIVVTGLVAVVAGLSIAPSARADIRTFSDVGAHITSVRVSHEGDRAGGERARLHSGVEVRGIVAAASAYDFPA